MFGLQQDDKTRGQAFDLEKDLSGPEKTQKLNEYRTLINGRIEGLKKALREGEDKEAFTKAEILLRGYSALLQVIERIAR